MTILYSKGTQLTCPDCGHLLATANRDIKQGDAGLAEDWDSPYPMGGWGQACPRCSGQQFRRKLGRLEIHTDKGWV